MSFTLDDAHPLVARGWSRRNLNGVWWRSGKNQIDQRELSLVMAHAANAGAARPSGVCAAW